MFLIFPVFLLISAYSFQTGLSKADQDLIVKVTERSAFLEAYVEFCAVQNPPTNDRSRRAYSAWQERNQFGTIREALSKQEKFRIGYEQLRERSSLKLSSTSAQTARVCPHLPELMEHPQFDTSVKSGADLRRIASEIRRNQAAVDPSSPSPVGKEAPPVDDARRRADGTTPPSPSGTQALGELTFSTPPGWRIERSREDLITLQHNSARGKTSLIMILSGPMRGAISEDFRQYVRSVLSRFELKLNRLYAGKTAYGHQAAYFDETIRDSRSGQRFEATGVAQAFGARIYVAILLRADDGETYKRRREFEELAGTFRFRGDNSDPVWNPLNPPKGAGGLEGLYFGSQLQNHLNAFGGMDLIAERRYMVFFPNGQVYRGLPDDGRVTDLDFAEALKNNREKLGVYRLQGNQIIFEFLSDFGVIEENAVPYKRRDSNSVTFSWYASMGRLYPVQNLRLSGTYTSTFGSSGTIGSQTAGVFSQKFIEFTPDGRYRKAGFTSASVTNDAVGFATGPVKNPKVPQTGRYTINGFRMTLTPDNGPPEHFTIVLEDPSPTTKALFINDSAYLK
jgi:hypothetical protein